MKHLNRYIAKQIISSTGVVLLVLIGLETFMEFVGQLDSLGQVNYDILHVGAFVLLHLPGDIYSMFPMVGLLGCLLGLGRLASSSELIVMQAAGVSVLQIAVSIIKTAILMLIVMTALGEIVAPILSHQAEIIRTKALHQVSANGKISDIWLHQNQNFVYIKDVKTDHQLAHILIYQYGSNHHLNRLLIADKAFLMEDGKWKLTPCKAMIFQSDHVSTLQLPTQFLTLNIDPAYLKLDKKDPMNASLNELNKIIHYREQSGLSSNQIRFVLWQRLLQPLTSIVMIVLAVPFIFGSLRSVSTGVRILIGVIIGFAFYMLNQIFGPISLLFQFPPLFAASIPTLMFACLGAYLLIKLK